MKLSEILKDSLRYPLLEWKKILVLGIIILISGLSQILGMSNIDLIVVLVGLGFLSGFLVNGYTFRIITIWTYLYNAIDKKVLDSIFVRSIYYTYNFNLDA